ncbi:hypothetical protein RJ641_013813 [Dillenia turbinata]|uniref:F-box protein n=1 Tax=Dillenia turbinata TaxID=194707 RepID=A0AAN8W502_9MAGN
MSDRQSVRDSDATTREPVHPYQSVWMGHWMQTGCKAVPAGGRQMPVSCETMEDGHDLKFRKLSSEQETEKNTLNSANGLRAMTESRRDDIRNESLPSSSKTSGKGKLDLQPFPIFNLCQTGKSSDVPTNDHAPTSERHAFRSQFSNNLGFSPLAMSNVKNASHSAIALGPVHMESSSKLCDVQSEFVRCTSKQQAKSSNSLWKSDSATERSLQDDIVGVSYRFNSGGVQMQQEICQPEAILATKEHFASASLAPLGHENSNYHSYSSFLVREEKKDDPINIREQVTSFLNMPMNDPSTSNKQSQPFLGGKCQRIRSHSGTGFFPSHYTSREMTGVGNLYHDYHPQPPLPVSTHNVETMRICATVDSVKGYSGGSSNFSQTTHHLFITQKADINFSKGDQIFRDSSVTAKFRGNTFSDFLSLSPFSGQRGVKVQLLDSSAESEEKEKVEDAKTSPLPVKNESSADTDTLDMDVLQDDNPISGVGMAQSKKEDKAAQNLSTSQATDGSHKLVRCKVELPDINEELPASPAPANSTDEMEPSTSRTQSLDVEHFLANAEHPMKSKGSSFPDELIGPEPSCRWVKRLKLSRSDSSSHGTKISKGETSSQENVDKILNNITKNRQASLDPTLVKRLGKEPMVLDDSTCPLNKGESNSMGLVKKDRDFTLSNSWIRRWCQKPQKKPEAIVTCEPKSSKGAADEFQKKQFPSIAAMALMGKAMGGFHPCELRKRGSLVVWNARGFSG